MAKRRQPAALRKYWATHRRGKKANPKRRRRYRRNPYPVAGLVVNPRRRRRSRGRVNARHHYRRRSRRNPAVLGFRIPPITSVLFAGVGFIAPPMVEGFLSKFIPTAWQSSTMGRYAVRIAAVIGLTFAVRKFVGVSEGNMTAIGGSVYVASTALREFAPGMIPGLGMYALPAPGMGAYVAGNQPNYAQMGQASIAMFPGSGAGSSGAVGGTAARFKRI